MSNQPFVGIEDKKVQWIIDRHRQTNHFYDEYLPYEFHLRMVVQVCKDFIHLPENAWSDLELACWGHDLIEDTRTSYNDCRMELGEYVADIIYAVTNEKGRNRKERANHRYYDLITKTRGATFVKVCDRIANVQYSKLTKSRMFDMYQREHEQFEKALKNERLQPMFDYLKNILL